MPETLEKLRPDRDLQCYFERPSAVAALSGASASGFTVSGTWRQQFDWAVIEWNRDNVFEHPLLRNLPDGDLSGLTLTYEETRTNAIPMDSDLFPTVDWPFLRVWTRANSVDDFYKVRLKDHAIAIEGSYTPAWAEMELQGTPTTGDYVGLSFLGENHTYQLYAVDTLETAAQALVDSVNAFSTQMTASRTGARIRLTYVGAGQNLSNSTTGANGNRVGVYGFVAGAKTETWAPWWSEFAGGQSPMKWRVTLNFGSLTAIDGRTVPSNIIRKMRWTYAAELQDGAFQRSEFQVVVSNWAVTGTGRAYQMAGVGSRRIEDSAPEIQYSGAWSRAKGNFSGGTIRWTTAGGAGLTCTYTCPQSHALYLGTRLAFNGSQISIAVDGQPATSENLFVAGEDALARIPLGQYGPGPHTVSVTHAGPAGNYLYFYFDFLEVAIVTATLPQFPPDVKMSLATDWDTDHSIALAAERTAWLMHTLGFRGRVNHYVGALWFYELVRPGHVYASATVDFSGVPMFSQITEIRIGKVGEPSTSDTVIRHLNLIGDTAETIAKAFELELNRGYTAVRALAQGTQLTIYARAMGVAGNTVTLASSPAAGTFLAQASGPTLASGVDGDWRTDLTASPRLNRAVRDWSLSFYQALKNYGLDVVAAFSLELQHGDPAMAAGIAQRYPDGSPVLLNTPALQTNFSPVSLAFWKQVNLDMAAILAQAGHQPYLQFGEVQWWYFPLAGVGMPFYDDYTKTAFQSQYGHPMQVIPSNTADPALYPEETAFLPGLIGSFTSQVMGFVRATYPTCRFEVLYPPDVNDTELNRLINYPTAEWTPAALDCLKTESFTYTLNRNLDLSQASMKHGVALGFPRHKRSHLVGISDSTTAWLKEVRMARADNVESVVLFALDQFCLIGYAAPLAMGMRRGSFGG